MKTYEEVMRERLYDGRGPRKIEEEISPGVKNLFAGKKRTAAGTPGVASVSVPSGNMPAVLKGENIYDNNYMANMYESEKNGNYAGAKYNEMMHNAKNDYLGLGYANSYIYNYDDPYGEELARQRAELGNRSPFSYDYRQDDMYETIRGLKEKEAQKAYNDGYAQLSTQFDGDIPANMINKLLTTKSEIIDQADSYIPTLRQMAYQMYMDEGDRMYQNYGLTQNAAAEDYNRWYADRDFHVGGLENEYNRNLAKEQFNYTKNRDAAEDAWNEKQFDYTKELNDRDAMNTRFEKARTLYATGLYSSFDEAYKAAGKY